MSESRAAHNALNLVGLTKSFGTAKAVDNLALQVRAGEFYALLGPNGAGKTTTLRMVAGLLPADAGEIEIFGVDARRYPIAAKRITAWLHVQRWIGNMKQLGSWGNINEVMYGFAGSMKGKQFEHV